MLLDEFSCIKVADFGLAVMSEDMRRTSLGVFYFYWFCDTGTHHEEGGKQPIHTMSLVCVSWPTLLLFIRCCLISCGLSLAATHVLSTEAREKGSRSLFLAMPITKHGAPGSVAYTVAK